MLELLLFRHAKAAAADAHTSDRHRVLTPRGHEAALAIGAEVAARGWVPDLVLCSDAARARETLEAASAGWRNATEVRSAPELYSAMGDEYLSIIRDEGGTARRLMLVGHNPAMQQTTLLLAGRGNVASIASAGRKFPTGALAALRFEAGAWDELEQGSGELVDLLLPPRTDD